MDKKEEFEEFIKENFSSRLENNKMFLKTFVNDVYVDLYIPNKKIAFKLRGYFWDKDNYQDPKKDTKILLDNGIRLIHIYDYEWFKFKDNFKKFIYYTINSRNKHMIRSTIVQTIEKEDFINFLRENHLFGDTIGGCRFMYGVYENNELVSVAGFDKKSGKYDWEFKRFCIKYGWMSSHNFVELYLNEFEKNHKGVLVDYQQMDRYPYNDYPDKDLGFKRMSWNQGIVCINSQTGEYTRHSFIAEKPLNKHETMLKYGFDIELKNAGTVTWVKEIV